MKNPVYKHKISVFSKFAPRLVMLLAMLPLLFSCAGGAKVASSGLGKGRDPVPFMRNARTGFLPSGMRYYLLENRRPEGRAYLTLAVNAGSVLETEEERGLAHFVEHMAFNGTARFAKSALINYLRSLGMRFGPEVNAYTSFDETVYGIEVPVETGPDSRKRIPDTALAVIDDWTWSVKFEPDAVENERPVIMEEYRSRLGAAERISREMYPLLFRGSPYAERLPIGLPDVIEHAPPGRLDEFYRRWYRPEHMAVIIVGDFDAAYLEASLAEHFPDHWTGGTAAGENGADAAAAGGNTADAAAADATAGAEEKTPARPRYNLSEPEKGSLQSLVITDSELSQSRIDLYWKRKAEPKRQDLTQYRESIIDNLANTMLALRFEEAAAKSETPYVWAGAGMAEYGYSSRYYILVAQAKTAAAKTSLRELLSVKESLSRYGFTQAELDSAGPYLLSYLEQLTAEKDNQPSGDYVDYFTRHFLKGETVPDIDWELEAVTKLLPGITLKEINKTVQNYFEDDDLTVIISAPEAEKDSLPGQNEIAALAAEIRRAKIDPPSEEKVEGELLSVVPSPGAIVSELTDNETGAVRWKLGNGAEVILKETQNKNNEISLYAQARGGTLSAPDETAVSAFLASEMLNVSGLGSWSQTELMKMLLDKQVSMSFWAQSFLRGFQGGAAVKDVKTLFEMLYLTFTEPRFDRDAIAAMLDQRRSTMAFQENDPDAVFNREIIRTMYGNPRFHPLEPEDIDKADIDEAEAFIRACLNPGDYAFVFTGNIDIGLFRSLTETYLASIPPSRVFNQWADIDPMRPSGADREIFKGREERSSVYVSWFAPRPYSEEDSAAVQVLNEYLEIQLNDEIREVLGGVYSISSWVSLSPIPRGELSGGVYFVCDPARTGELIRAVQDEFGKIAGGTIDAGAFEQAVLALVRGEEQSVQSNLYIAQSYANSAVIYDSPLSRLDKRPELYRNSRPAGIQRLAAELTGGSSVRFILKPEAGAGTQGTR